MEKKMIIFFEFYKKLITQIYNDKELESITKLDQIINLVKLGEIDFSDNLAFYLLNKKTRLGKLPQVISHFRFITFERNNNLIVFARNSNYNFNYVLVVNTGKIVIISDDGETQFEIAKNEKSFLEVLICLCEYEMQINKGVTSKIESNKIKLKAIKYAGGEAYKSYYNLIF